MSLKCRHREAFLEENLEREKGRIQEQIDVGDSLLPMAYVPHNIDDMRQAFCLSSLFNNWVNMANSVFNSD